MNETAKEIPAPKPPRTIDIRAVANGWVLDIDHRGENFCPAFDNRYVFSSPASLALAVANLTTHGTVATPPPAPEPPKRPRGVYLVVVKGYMDTTATVFDDQSVLWETPCGEERTYSDVNVFVEEVKPLFFSRIREL